ncbi:MAG: pyridoxal phosphate-dependent decarboxylase family protein [Gammaproteobacteria bacterium]
MVDRAPKFPGNDSRLLTDSEAFRAAGHALVDQIADFYASLPERPVTAGESPAQVRALLPEGGLPATGRPAQELLTEVAPLLFDHSLHNGHPRFLAYITSSASPLGALADLLAASVNPNVGRFDVAPFATAVEQQTVSWLAELVGFPVDCGGIMVSGGNMANFLAFIAARQARTSWDVRHAGLQGDARRLTAYVSAEAHTWVDKAADVGGLGADAIRWVETDTEQRMVPDALRAQIAADRADGRLPFLVVGTAGTTGTGAIDPLPELAAIAKDAGLWFHVDGAYGAPAAALPEAPPALKALSLADSVALDPHKWLYSPLEAACVLVREAETLSAAFSFLPSYYKVDQVKDDEAPVVNFYNLGMQNSRSFRALKVWLGLRNVGRDGIIEMIRSDIALIAELHAHVQAHAEFETRSLSLSITTFRYRPTDLPDDDQTADYLNRLNRRLLDELQGAGEAFVSNALIDDAFWLRACVVNFRTTAADMAAIPDIIARLGRQLDNAMRSNAQ